MTASPANTRGSFDYDINFVDSLVYFDGQFCEPHPDLLDPTSTANISSTTGFYLYPVTSSRTADFRDGSTTHSIAIDYTFKWSTTIPSATSGLSYIAFQRLTSI